MEINEIEEIVQEIFESLLDNEKRCDVRQCRKQSSQQWDSMFQVNLIAALEGEFDIALDIEASRAIESYQDCVTTITDLI